ncbi:MAG TPA: hypothetical protein VFH48_19095 [Chloroflexota bacterium]|nr:hypothetical protein [Chloroflexota bacterium]
MIRAGLAALALSLATALPVVQPSTVAAWSGPDSQSDIQAGITDISVRYVGMKWQTYSTGTGVDVAFEIQNVGTVNVPAPDLKLTATCNYRQSWGAQQPTGSDKKVASMGIQAGTPAVPYLVSCPPMNRQFVSSVVLHAEARNDSDSSNNVAHWDFAGNHS